MIFPVCEIESTILQNEKVRISAIDSYVTKDEPAITKVEIQPYAAAGFVTVTGSTSKDWYYDYAYSTTGDKVISVKITTTASPTPVVTTITKTVTVVSDATAALFSTDSDLKIIESDIMKWLPTGRFTYNNIHFRVQENILTDIKKNRILNSDGTDILKTQILDVKEVREWAAYSALAMIFNSISNAVDDVFSKKSFRYYEMAQRSQNLALNMLSLDLNKDSAITIDERLDLRSVGMVRR
jgi:hypothetical protein